MFGKYFTLSCAAAALLAAQSAHAGEAASPEFPAEPQLQGVEREEARQLVEDLKAAQLALRAGADAYFHLLSGAPASYDAANLGPRDAFLALDWGNTLWVRELEHGNPYGTAYRLEILPEGFGYLVWDVRVWKGVSGNLERIELFNRPPNPF